MNGKKKILIVDDHGIVSMGLNYLITLNFTDCEIDQVSSLKALLQKLPGADYTHLILDLNLEDGSSIDILPEVTEKYPELQILIYSMASEDVYGKRLMSYNISGFLSKKTPEDEVVRALQVFLNGGVFVSRKLKRSMDAGWETGKDNLFHHLSTTELKVLNLLMRGHKTKEIAGELNVTQQTIATFKSRIFKKLGTENMFDIQKLARLYDVHFS